MDQSRGAGSHLQGLVVQDNVTEVSVKVSGCELCPPPVSCARLGWSVCDRSALWPSCLSVGQLCDFVRAFGEGEHPLRETENVYLVLRRPLFHLADGNYGRRRNGKIVRCLQTS
jgi:hypothetical protein